MSIYNLLSGYTRTWNPLPAGTPSNHIFADTTPPAFALPCLSLACSRFKCHLHRVLPQLYAPRPCLVSPSCCPWEVYPFFLDTAREWHLIHSAVWCVSVCFCYLGMPRGSSSLPCCGGRCRSEEMLDKCLEVKCCPVPSSAFWGSEYSQWDWLKQS